MTARTAITRPELPRGDRGGRRSDELERSLGLNSVYPTVMPGLVQSRLLPRKTDVDGRDKPGHDGDFSGQRHGVKRQARNSSLNGPSCRSSQSSPKVTKIPSRPANAVKPQHGRSAI